MTEYGAGAAARQAQIGGMDRAEARGRRLGCSWRFHGGEGACGPAAIRDRAVRVPAERGLRWTECGRGSSRLGPDPATDGAAALAVGFDLKRVIEEALRRRLQLSGRSPTCWPGWPSPISAAGRSTPGQDERSGSTVLKKTSRARSVPTLAICPSHKRPEIWFQGRGQARSEETAASGSGRATGHSAAAARRPTLRQRLPVRRDLPRGWAKALASHAAPGRHRHDAASTSIEISCTVAAGAHAVGPDGSRRLARDRLTLTVPKNLTILLLPSRSLRI